MTLSLLHAGAPLEMGGAEDGRLGWRCRSSPSRTPSIALSSHSLR